MPCRGLPSVKQQTRTFVHIQDWCQTKQVPILSDSFRTVAVLKDL